MFRFQNVSHLGWAPGHKVPSGLARTRNPYRTGEAVHPSMFCKPRNNRKHAEQANQHTTHPAR